MVLPSQPGPVWDCFHSSSKISLRPLSAHCPSAHSLLRPLPRAAERPTRPHVLTGDFTVSTGTRLTPPPRGVVRRLHHQVSLTLHLPTPFHLQANQDNHARCAWDSGTARCAGSGGDFICEEATFSPTQVPT